MNFYVASAGQPDEDYLERNFERIITHKSFNLHENTPQKGAYEKVRKGDVLILKYNDLLVCYGKVKGNRNTKGKEFNLWIDVDYWVSHDLTNIRKGVSKKGIQDASISGGQYGTIKEVKSAYALKKMKQINKENSLYTYINENHMLTDSELKSKEIEGLLLSKKQIILQGPPGTGKTRLAEEIAKSITDISKEQIININSFSDVYIASILEEGLKIDSVKERTQYEINKIQKSKCNVTLVSTSKSYDITFNGIRKAIENKLWTVGKQKNGLDPYNAAIGKYLYDKSDFELSNQKNYKVVQFHASYSYEDFVRGISVETTEKGDVIYKVKNRILAQMAQDAINDENNNYVLIIDEINRANLSSVLGELIYALEYRGEPVESLYDLKDKGREIVLPKNLFIIGTMNTADRSVGHIDYAIRRRFAFESVLPKDLSGELGSGYAFAKAEFDKVKALFVNDIKLDWDHLELKKSIHLSDEFDPKDVCIGHSYFICEAKNGDKESEEYKKHLRQRLDYEIKPILEEYIKDGVLIDSPELHAALKKI